MGRPMRIRGRRLKAEILTAYWAVFGAFDVDLMAADVPAQRSLSGKLGAGQLPFLSQYACSVAAAMDTEAQDVA